jgi:hypothetical protein
MKQHPTRQIFKFFLIKNCNKTIKAKIGDPLAIFLERLEPPSKNLIYSPPGFSTIVDGLKKKPNIVNA